MQRQTKLSADIAHPRRAQHKQRHVVTLRYEASAEREAPDTRTGLAADPLVFQYKHTLRSCKNTARQISSKAALTIVYCINSPSWKWVAGCLHESSSTRRRRRRVVVSETSSVRPALSGIQRSVGWLVPRRSLPTGASLAAPPARASPPTSSRCQPRHVHGRHDIHASRRGARHSSTTVYCPHYFTVNNGNVARTRLPIVGFQS